MHKKISFLRLTSFSKKNLLNLLCDRIYYHKGLGQEKKIEIDKERKRDCVCVCVCVNALESEILKSKMFVSKHKKIDNVEESI